MGVRTAGYFVGDACRWPAPVTSAVTRPQPVTGRTLYVGDWWMGKLTTDLLEI